MLPRLEALSEQALVRAVSSAHMEEQPRAEYLRDLREAVDGNKRARRRSHAHLGRMGVDVVMEPPKPKRKRGARGG